MTFIYKFLLKYIFWGASNMAQWVKELAAKPKNLTKFETQNPYNGREPTLLLTSILTLQHAHTHTTHIEINVVTFFKNIVRK